MERVRIKLPRLKESHCNPILDSNSHSTISNKSIIQAISEQDKSNRIVPHITPSIHVLLHPSPHISSYILADVLYNRHSRVDRSIYTYNPFPSCSSFFILPVVTYRKDDLCLHLIFSILTFCLFSLIQSHRFRHCIHTYIRYENQNMYAHVSSMPHSLVPNWNCFWTLF